MGAWTSKTASISVLAILFTGTPLSYATDLPSTMQVDRGETISMTSESDEGLSFGSALVEALADDDAIYEMKSGGEMLTTENSTIEANNIHISRRLRRHFRIQRNIQRSLQETGVLPRTFNTEESQRAQLQPVVVQDEEVVAERNALSRQRVICRMQKRIMDRSDMRAVRMRLLARYAKKLGMTAKEVENEIRSSSACDFELYVVIEAASEDDASESAEGSSSSHGAILEMEQDEFPVDSSESEDEPMSSDESSDNDDVTQQSPWSSASSSYSTTYSASSSEPSWLSPPVPVSSSSSGDQESSGESSSESGEDGSEEEEEEEEEEDDMMDDAFSPLQQRMLCRIQARTDGYTDATLRSLSLRWKKSADKIEQALNDPDVCTEKKMGVEDTAGEDNSDEDGDTDEEDEENSLIHRVTELPMWMLLVLGLFAGFFILFILTVISIALRARPR